MDWAGLASAVGLLALLPLGASAQAGRRVAVPREIVAQLIRDTAAYEMMPTDADTLAANLGAEALDLGGAGPPALFVHGMLAFCGAQNCPAWIYRRTSAGYERLLAAYTVQAVEVRATISHGYRDVVTFAHSSASDSYLTRYRFDGRVYRPVACYLRTVHYHDARGNDHQLARARTTASGGCPGM
jgi:hypothetical protein